MSLSFLFALLQRRFCSSAGTLLQVDLMDPPDLTDTLQRDKKRIVGHGSFGTVYSCLCTQNGEVSMFAFPLRTRCYLFSPCSGCGQGYNLASWHQASRKG